MNPVFRGELLRRWRGRRAFLVLSLFLLVLALLLFGVHEIGRQLLRQQMFFGGGDIAFMRPTLGRFMVETVLSFLLMLVLVAAPGFAAGQIAGERERRTLPLLQATLLRPVEIVAGKLWAATAWVGLLVVAALPLVAISTVFGGVETPDVLLGLGTVLLIGLCLAAVSLGVSSLVKRTTAAVVISYAIVLTLVLGTGFVAILLAVVADQREVATWPLYANPFLPLAGAVNSSVPGGQISLPSPLSPFAVALLFAEGGVLGVDVGPMGVGQDLARTWRWLWALAVFLGMAALGIVVAARRLRITGSRSRITGRRRARTDREAVGG